MIRHRDFIRVGDFYFSAVGYSRGSSVRCLLRYVPSDEGDRLNSEGRRYKKLSHAEALRYPLFEEFKRNGVFFVPMDVVDEIYRPDERLEEVCERDGVVARLADFFRLRRMGVTGSRLIGLSKGDSDVDFVAYGFKNFEKGRLKIKEGFEEGTLDPPDLVKVYERRKVNLPFEVFRVHEERKFNKAKIDGVNFDLLFVRENETPPIPEEMGVKMGTATILAEVTDSRFAFDYPACYFVDHPEIEAVLSYTHTFIGQAFEGEVLEARGVLEEIDGKLYLIVGTLRESENEYIVSMNLLKSFNLEREFAIWKVKTFKR